MSGTEVVIVGGGIAGLTTAFELTDPRRCRMRVQGCKCPNGDRHPECSLPARVSVYERRAELGGKGASVRNRERGLRIEEHGLHIWFGYYENAFRLLDRCHRELDQRGERWSNAICHVADGFRPASNVGLADDDLYGAWSLWWATFPEDQALPWDRKRTDEPADFDLEWFLPEVGQRTTALLHAAMRSLTTGENPGELAGAVEAVEHVLRDLDPVLDRLFSAALKWSAYLRRLSVGEPRSLLVSGALANLRGMDQLLDYLRESRDHRIAGNATMRRLMTIVDLLVGATRGLLAGGIADENDVDRLDSWEWSDWLAANGVLGVSRNSTLVRALSYCLPFAYELGSRDLPSFSAAVGLRLFVRTFFTYRGALMWKMNHGMGEVVFAPLYELLKKRNVEFHFEHELKHVAVQDGQISELVFDYSAAGSADERAAHAVGWPLEQLELADGSTLGYWPFREPRQLPDEKAVDTSACRVVLALPLPALKPASTELQRDARWHAAFHGRKLDNGARVRALGSVATQAAQLWLTRPAESALGWPADVTVSGFSEPFDTFSDMTELLPSERIRDERHEVVPAGLVYLCSTQPDPEPPRDPAERIATPQERAQNDLALFLWERASYLWPQASEPDGRIDRGLVIGAQGLVSLAQATDKATHPGETYAPYVRANSAPADRYMLSLPGTAAVRIEPGNTGFLNLFVAGDWTACVLNAGCIEAATISGMLAAEALLETTFEIIGRGEAARKKLKNKPSKR